MNATQQPIPTPTDVFRILATYWRHWAIPAGVLGAIALVYAVLGSESWEASQALIVRNEATNNDLGPGKFSQTDERKTVQETILELVKSRGVLEAALRQVGRPADVASSTAWPSLKTIERFGDKVELIPPKGSEFGKSEVFYLKVRDANRGRAAALARALCDQLGKRLQEVRNEQTGSMIAELNHAVKLARADRAAAVTALTAIESEVGSDLGELRALEQSFGDDGALRRMVVEIRNELRQLHTTRQANETLLALLREAQGDPSRLVATPNPLLESQPALRRLKDGLIDAQLSVANLQGRMMAEHPLVQAARQSAQEVRDRLHGELAVAIRGLEVDLRMNGDRQTMLQEQLDTADARLGRLAALRAEYSTRLADMRHREQLVEQSERNLSEARAAHASAKATSLVARIDGPQTGSDPAGPGRAAIVLLGVVGGLIAGFGWLFLSVPWGQPGSAEGNGHDWVPQLTPSTHSVERLSLNQALRKVAVGTGA